MFGEQLGWSDSLPDWKRLRDDANVAESTDQELPELFASTAELIAIWTAAGRELEPRLGADASNSSPPTVLGFAVHHHRTYHRTYGTTRLRHPVVGDRAVDDQTLTLPSDQDTPILCDSTEPNFAFTARPEPAGPLDTQLRPRTPSHH